MKTINIKELHSLARSMDFSDFMQTIKSTLTGKPITTVIDEEVVVCVESSDTAVLSDGKIHHKVQHEINDRLDILESKIDIADTAKESRSYEAGAFNELNDLKEWFAENIALTSTNEPMSGKELKILNEYYNKCKKTTSSREPQKADSNGAEELIELLGKEGFIKVVNESGLKRYLNQFANSDKEWVSVEEIEKMLRHFVAISSSDLEEFMKWYKSKLPSDKLKDKLKDTLITILEYFKGGLDDVEAGSGERQTMQDEIDFALPLIKKST